MSGPIDLTTLNNLTPNLDSGDTADPALRKAAFQYLYGYAGGLYEEMTGLVSAGTLSRLGTINIKDYGAKGDGETDNTLAMNAVISAVASAGGGIVFIPNGVFITDTILCDGLENVIFYGTPFSVLKMKGGTSRDTAKIFDLDNCNNIHILDMVLDGNRDNIVNGTGDGSAHNIEIDESTNIYIEKVFSRNAGTDCLYLRNNNANINVSKSAFDNAYRNCLSITGSLDGFKAEDCKFINAIGAAPQAGADIEPNATAVITNIKFVGCEYSGNASRGLVFDIRHESQLTDVVIENTVFKSNVGENLVVTARGVGTVVDGISLKSIVSEVGTVTFSAPDNDATLLNIYVGSNCRFKESQLTLNNVKNGTVTGNYFYRSAGLSHEIALTQNIEDILISNNQFMGGCDRAIYRTVAGTAKNIKISNNIIQSKGVHAIHVEQAIENFIAIGNTIELTTSRAFSLANVTGGRIEANILDSNGSAIHLTASTTGVVVANNIFRDNTFNISTTNSWVGNSAQGNTGIITRKRGSASITSALTLIVVAHGLSITPSAQDIQVTPITSLGSAATFYVDTVGATNFTIRVNTAPGSTVTFAWSADVEGGF